MYMIAAFMLWFTSFGFYCMARLNQDWEDVISEKIFSLGSLFAVTLGIYFFSLDALIRLGWFYP